jgi:hypothetical protein
MKKKDIMPFVGKYVKLAYQNGFVIEGMLNSVSEEIIFFSTKKTTSVIDIRAIASIVLRKGRDIDGQ